ncbi:type-F conjugative transfer system secretin TraK, partial [Klebsiella pneumoniae]
SVPVTSEVLQEPPGLRATADRVWVGHHLKDVRYSLDNVSLSARLVRESDFWQPGTRAVMVSPPAGLLTDGARMQLSVT